MEVKVHSQNWAELDFLINNFYEIVEYKRGRGIYGDRVILKRSKRPECIFGEKDKYYEFYYLNANAVKELPRTIFEKINIIKRIVTSPENMNLLCDFVEQGSENLVDWATQTSIELSNANTLNFDALNNILIKRYSMLGEGFISKLNEHRRLQYFLATSPTLNLIT
ncbi:MAG: hypothetical protein J6Q15_02585, partial [Clostridia bacterium]|nr:hypothetical protein [Clostridia bacterium]